jgi:hypothetical protein
MEIISLCSRWVLWDRYLSAEKWALFFWGCFGSCTFLQSDFLGHLNACSSRPRAEESLVRWATPQLHDIDTLTKMVDPALKGIYPVKSLSRFADVIALCVQVTHSIIPSQNVPKFFKVEELWCFWMCRCVQFELQILTPTWGLAPFDLMPSHNYNSANSTLHVKHWKGGKCTELGLQRSWSNNSQWPV